MIGICGGQRFYLGQVGLGFLYLFTCGLFGIGQFIDLFLLSSEVDRLNRFYSLPPGNNQFYPYQRRLHPKRRSHQAPNQPVMIPAPPPAPPPREKKSDLSTQEQIEIALVKAAKARGGKLTISDAVFDLNLPPAKVQEVLDSMAANGYIELDPTSGTLEYIFN